MGPHAADLTSTILPNKDRNILRTVSVAISDGGEEEAARSKVQKLGRDLDL